MLNAGWFYDNPASGHVLAKLGFSAGGEGETPVVARGAARLLSTALCLTARPT